MHTERKEIRIGESKFFYRTAGTATETVILLHGIPTNSFIWVHVIPQLAQHYTVIAPDMLGFGQSDRATREKLTLPMQAEYIIKIMEKLGIQAAHIIGHDLGGGVAQILAVNHPEKITSFMVIDGVAFNNWPLPKVVALRYPTSLEFQSPVLFIEKMFSGGLFHLELLTPELLEPFLSPFNHPKGMLELLEASFALDHHQTEDLVPQLAQIQLPATFLYGQYDRYLPAYWGLRLQEAVPNSSFKVLPECSHFSMIDNPLLVSQEILAHLEKT
ncbi:alpha/beta fold hydrolase [Planomicrobium sp. CPCC 101079]|uniref:alpha/beta fold hydrolase n=1 Tax=Planomicrobium sp. CPCC 101079 TaxID=2599618 RepID=UPI0011B67AB2|nr:alpha/beta hydrolase [Planomicrobium sp. CPCC 101079]TWT14613.1 alpha/beta hydrolase [Planomicrobium sp. CPCC 101079]